jgi:hypothetical protein
VASRSMDRQQKRAGVVRCSRNIVIGESSS